MVIQWAKQPEQKRRDTGYRTEMSRVLDKGNVYNSGSGINSTLRLLILLNHRPGKTADTSYCVSSMCTYACHAKRFAKDIL